MSLPSVGNRNIDSNFNTISKEIDALKRAVNARQEGSTQGLPLANGDIRFIKGDDNSGYLEIGGKDGVYTTFQGGFQLKGSDTPYAYLHKLFVDNFYAKNIFAQSIRTTNGNLILSNSGIVGSVIGSTSFTVKNPDGTLLNPFVVGDLLYTAKFGADHSVTIKELRLDVTAVSGLTVTYTKSSESGAGIPTQIGSLAAGDVIVQIGNNNLGTNPDRGSVIVIATSDIRDFGGGNRNYAPYVKILNTITTYNAFFNGVPLAQLGLLGTINDVDYTSLYGSTEAGLYTTNAYLKGKLQIGSRSDIIGADWIISSRSASAPASPLNGDLWYDTANKKLYRWDSTIGTPAWVDVSERQMESFIGSTAPASPLPGDFWFDTTVTLNQLKRWNGAAWVGVGANGTYIDATGVYTSTVAANQVIAGDLIGFTIKGNSTPATTGGLYIDQDEVRLYKPDSGSDDFVWKVWNSLIPIMSWTSTAFGVDVSFGPVQGATPIPDGIQCTGRLLAVGGFEVDTYFDVDASGNITKINNIPYSFPSVAPTLNQVLTCTNATGGVLGWSSFAPMVYPGVGIALSTGSAWGTSITDNSTAWNSAATWVSDYGSGSRANWDAAYNNMIASASFNTGDGIITLTQQDAGTVTVDIDGRYLTAAITSLGGLTAATQTFATGTSGTAPAFSSATSTHTLNIPMAATASVTAGLISKTEYDTFNGKQSTLSWGSTAGYSTPNTLVHLNINGTDYAVAVYVP